MNPPLPEPQYIDKRHHDAVAYTEAQLLDYGDLRAAAAVLAERERCIGFLILSRDTFALNFGKNVNADWVYADLNELLKAEMK